MVLPLMLQQGAQALLDSDTSVGKALRFGVDQPTENFATTLQAMGFKGAEKFMRELIDAPENYESAAGKFINEQNKEHWGDYEWKHFPLFVVEQAGQLAGSLITRAGGASAGMAIGGPPTALALGLLGPALFEAVQVAGPIAMDHAKRRAPVGVEKEPTWDDWKYAIPGTLFSGVLNAIGVFNIGKLNSTILGSGLREGVTETGQGLTEQIFGSLGTPGGVEIDTHAAVAEGLAGAGTGVAAQTPVSVAGMLRTPTPTDAITEMAETVNPPLVTETITEEPPTPTEAEEPPAVSPEDFRPAFTDEEIAAGDVPLLTQVPEEITAETFFALPADLRARYRGSKIPTWTGNLRGDPLPPQEEFQKHINTWQAYLIGAGKTPISKQEMGQLLGRKIEEDTEFAQSDFNERVDEYVKKGYIADYNHQIELHKIKKTDDDYGKIPDTEYTRSPQFKQDLAEYIIRQKLGLTRTKGAYLIERPTARFEQRKGRYDPTIVEAAQNLLFEKAVDNFYKPLTLDAIKSLEDQAQQGNSSSQFITSFLERLPPQEREKVIESFLLGNLHQRSFIGEGDYLTSWSNAFEKPTKETEELIDAITTQPFDSLVPANTVPIDDLVDQLQEKIVGSLQQMESETFKQRMEKEGFFENFEAEEPTLFENLTDREKGRLKTSLLSEVKNHPELYRFFLPAQTEGDRVGFIDDTTPGTELPTIIGQLEPRVVKDKIRDLIRSLNIAKQASKLSKGLPQDVINRFSGHSRLNTFEDVVRGTLVDDIDLVSDAEALMIDAVGPLTPRVFTVAELAQGKSGPIDPNFLSYSVLREQLDKLQSEGLVSLPANEMLSYLTEPYSKLDPELKQKEGVPKFSDPKPQAAAKSGGYARRQNLQTRQQEAQDMQILPFLEAVGKQDVDIAYLKNLITHHLSGFDIHVVRDWVPGETVYEYQVIKGPTLGRFDIITQHLPLLSPSEQALVDRQRTEGDLTPEETERLKNIFETSPDVYTERDMHNWAKHRVSGIKGMGTVMWIRGTRRQALPKKNSRFKDQEVIGWMPDESQSYWIQKTRAAIKRGKKYGTAPSRTFRYDYAKERQDQTQVEQKLDLDELIIDEATLREPAREELKNYLINTPIDKTKQFPEGHWKGYLTRGDVGERALNHLLRDINKLYRGDTRGGEHLTDVPVSKWNVGAQTFLQRDPAYKEKFNKLDEREEELEDTFYEELLIEEQPFTPLGKRIDDQTLAEIKERQLYSYRAGSLKEKVTHWVISQGWDMHSIDPERADEKELQEVLYEIQRTANDEAEAVIKVEMAEAQKKAVDKITKHLPDFSEYVKTIKRMPSEAQVRAYEESLREGDRTIMPDPPFRESFNRMNLRLIVTQSLKNGEKFIILPGSMTGAGSKATFDLEVQTKYGQPRAPEGNYKQILMEGHALAEEFGLVLEVMELDVGDGNKADVTVINIEPLYSENLIPEEGAKGYKHGGLVTKSQGAGYNMNYGDYGRNYV
jgi:hypothetical protein